jgi:hypothetical protein
LYDFDLSLDAQVDDITAALDQLASAAMNKEGVGEAVAGLNRSTATANDTFNRRKDVLTGTANI